jgi:hypothetical protein
MLDAESLAGVAEGEGFVAGAIVGHDPGDGYPEAGVVGHGGLQEGDGAFFFLVGQNLAEGDARGVVDADVDELPTDAPAVALTGAIAGDAVADLVEAAQLLDVDMDQFARMLALIAHHRFGGLQISDPAKFGPPQYPAHRRRRDGNLPGDLLAGPALAAQGDDLFLRLGQRRPAQPLGA